MLNIFPTPMMLMCRTWVPSLLLISLLASPTLTNNFGELVYITSRLPFWSIIKYADDIYSAVNCDAIDPGACLAIGAHELGCCF
jgi:hypothetical protein